MSAFDGVRVPGFAFLSGEFQAAWTDSGIFGEYATKTCGHWHPSLSAAIACGKKHEAAWRKADPEGTADVRMRRAKAVRRGRS